MKESSGEGIGRATRGEEQGERLIALAYTSQHHPNDRAVVLFSGGAGARDGNGGRWRAVEVSGKEGQKGGKSKGRSTLLMRSSLLLPAPLLSILQAVGLRCL